MSDKLVRPIDIPWGEDLVAIYKSGGELADIAEEKLFTKYVLSIRKSLEGNSEAREIAAKAQPATSAKNELMRVFTEWNLFREGARDVFEKALDEILQELDYLRKANVGLVLIDGTSGKSIMPFTPEMLYTPPDYVGEDGKLHKSKPILHPSISGPYGLMLHEQARTQELIKKAQDPTTRNAYEHVANPGKIIELASERLKHVGVNIEPNLDVDSTDFEFGREQVDGIEQSPNVHFHRTSMYSAVLATKVLQACGSGGICSFGIIRERKNSKQRWYSVPVKIKKIEQLH